MRLARDDLKGLVERNFLEYASYVILDRAIPNVVDGLKPVQRRILYTLKKIDDGKLHKVANVVGQTMAFHPHGDAAIGEALTNLANKDYLLDRQGNFGNLYTGDPASATRYIETRLSPLARETLFNKELTEFIPSYDGRNDEPVVLPAKVPVLLMHGAEGIAVGMSTKILPHNFCELIEAEIAHLEGKPFTVYPDFPTGGIADCSAYDKGNGKVRLRAKLNIVDDKTIVVQEICHGTTTESLIRSIDEAAKRGKIKLDSINDYTAEQVEIEINLPRGQHAKEVVDQLYAFTDCEISLSPSMLVIRDNLPWETNTDEVIELHTDLLKGYLKRELELEQDRLLDKIYDKTLEQIFIENRLYKKIESVKTYEGVHEAIAKALVPFHKLLDPKPDQEDREKLLAIPIRRISAFDIAKNEEEIRALEEQLTEVEKKLRNIKKTTIDYLKELLKKHGDAYPRRTQIEEIEKLDVRAIQTKNVKVGYDVKTGFLGTAVVSDTFFECTNFDKVLLIYKQGNYRVINLPEKMYVHTDGTTVAWAGVADKKTLFRAVYTDAGGIGYAKRFIVDKFILDREYEYLPGGAKLELLTTEPDTCVEVEFQPKPKQRVKKIDFPLDEVPIKGAKAKGIRINGKPVKKIRICKKK